MQALPSRSKTDTSASASMVAFENPLAFPFFHYRISSCLSLINSSILTSVLPLVCTYSLIAIRLHATQIPATQCSIELACSSADCSCSAPSSSLPYHLPHNHNM